MKTTIEEIRNYVESKTGLDISRKTRKRQYVDARALYYKLSRENTDASLEEIGALVNRDHSSVVHSVLHCFDAVYKFNPLIRNIYDDFQPILVACPETLTKQEINNIVSENKALRARLEYVENRNGRMIDLVAKVPEEALDDFFSRASAMITMLQSARYHQVAKRELQGAEL